jgi:hypothetical protein
MTSAPPWRGVLGAGEAEVMVRQAAETVSAGHEYSVEIAGNTLKGTVKDTGGWAKFEQVSLGNVKMDRAGEVKILLRPVKRRRAG